MPWYEPPPSVEELDYWKIEGGDLFHQVSKWPHPNTVRIQAKFRVKHAAPELIPLASRWGVFSTEGFSPYDPSTPEFHIFGWAEAEVRATDHIGFSIPESGDGWEVDVNIKGKDDLDFLGGPGIEIEQDWTHTANGSLHVVSEWPRAVGVSGFRYNQNTWFIRTNPIFTVYEASENWPQFWNPWIFAASDCFEFERFPVGMAAFNGSDAYIALDHNITGFNHDFVIECDVRLNDSSTWWPVFGQAGLGGFIGMDGADLIFGSLREPTTWTPVDDVWFNWRLEFEQPDQLKVKLFIDDVLRATSITNRFNAPINRIGVYKQGVGGSLWMDGDIKNLKVLLGDYPSTDVELDMPLIENALDAGPEANHGTTFNMELPTV